MASRGSSGASFGKRTLGTNGLVVVTTGGDTKRLALRTVR
jgi:hypothetical protein